MCAAGCTAGQTGDSALYGANTFCQPNYTAGMIWATACTDTTDCTPNLSSSTCVTAATNSDNCGAWTEGECVLTSTIVTCEAYQTCTDPSTNTCTGMNCDPLGNTAAITSSCGGVSVACDSASSTCVACTGANTSVCAKDATCTDTTTGICTQSSCSVSDECQTMNCVGGMCEMC
jgi:hypothetical protein